ncbi:MAG: hypothetical protein GY720_13475 [bacterium]|nr:hypothetical protein [bacterium]
MTDLYLTEAFSQFLSSLKAAKKSSHTVAAYRRDLMTLDDVTVPALRHAFGLA